MPTERYRRRVAGGHPPARIARVLILAVVTIAALSLTVGVVTGVIAGVLLALDRLVLPDRHVLATGAVVALVLVPVFWFLGSDLPLTPPAPRIQSNTLAHHVGGLAVWLLFLSVMMEFRPISKESM